MRLHLVDGTWELYRAHFSPRPGRLDPSGRDVKATLGLVESLLALLHDPVEAVTHVAVAFDNPIRSFRNDLFEGYKDDVGVPPELHAQFDAAEEAVRVLGVTVWSMREFEADDALATAAARFAPAVEQVRICSPDKDLGQCLSGRRVVQVDRMRRREVDETALRAQRGFGPGSVPDFLALVGDDADGLPGLPGFGERTAALILGIHPHLEEIPADPAAWPDAVRGAARLARELQARRDEALLYRRLATLVRDVPLRESLTDLAWPGLPASRFVAWCETLGATRLRDRASAPGMRVAGPG